MVSQWNFHQSGVVPVGFPDHSLIFPMLALKEINPYCKSMCFFFAGGLEQLVSQPKKKGDPI